MPQSVLLWTLEPDPGSGRSFVLRLSKEVTEPQREAVRTLLEMAARVPATLGASRQEAAIAKLAEILLPDDLAAARGTLAADNLELRDRFIAETAPLTSADIGAQAGKLERHCNISAIKIAPMSA